MGDMAEFLEQGAEEELARLESVDRDNILLRRKINKLQGIIDDQTRTTAEVVKELEDERNTLKARVKELEEKVKLLMESAEDAAKYCIECAGQSWESQRIKEAPNE